MYHNCDVFRRHKSSLLGTDKLTRGGLELFIYLEYVYTLNDIIVKATGKTWRSSVTLQQCMQETGHVWGVYKNMQGGSQHAIQNKQNEENIAASWPESMASAGKWENNHEMQNLCIFCGCI